MRILFLDDDPERHDRFRRMSIGHVVDHVHSADEAIAALQGQQYDLVCLDHDLGGRVMVDSRAPEGTGYHVTLAMEQAAIEKRPDVIVHSMNPVGAERMLARLHGAGYRAVHAPFGTWALSPTKEGDRG